MTIENTYSPEEEARLRADAAEIIARYPHSRSAIMPLLHLIQSVDGFCSPRGIVLVADILGLTRAQVSAVATFYSQYRRHPNGEYNVGVCTNALCAVMGGDIIWDELTEKLGVGADETTADGKITLERLECNAGCDYAPVMMINWEFFDNQTPESAKQIIDDILAGKDIHPTRGPEKVHTFQENERVLAGFEDGHVDEGVGAGEPTLRGLKIAREKGWTAPQAMPENSANISEISENTAEGAEK